jgi:hypothetical protein
MCVCVIKFYPISPLCGTDVRRTANREDEKYYRTLLCPGTSEKLQQELQDVLQYEVQLIFSISE